MGQMRVFVSHSSSDNAICEALVKALRDAGADVWYDQHNLGAGQLTEELTKELRSRPVFVVVLSKAAFASSWVRGECQWAFNLHQREPNRVILPVVAQTIELSDFDALLYMEGFKRVEAPGNRPYPPHEAVRETLRLLGLSTDAKSVSPVDGLVIKGQELHAEKRYSEAAAVYAQAVRQASSNFDAWSGLGAAYGELGRWSEALEAFERATAIRPDDDNAWSSKSATLTNLGRHKEALAACERAITLNPQNPVAWNNKAGILGGLRRYNDAVGAVEHAIALDPTNAGFWTNKGSLLTYTQRKQEALQAFDRAIELDPQYHRPWGEKALTLFGLRDAPAALASVDRAIALNPNVGQYWWVRGGAQAKLMNLSEAVTSMDRCLAIEPNNTQARQLRDHAAGVLRAAQQSRRRGK